jgi:hypothetical protein
MMYRAWICYPHTYDLDDNEPEIKFSEPDSYKYSKIIPISFSVLHDCTDDELRK